MEITALIVLHNVMNASIKMNVYPVWILQNYYIISNVLILVQQEHMLEMAVFVLNAILKIVVTITEIVDALLDALLFMIAGGLILADA